MTTNIIPRPTTDADAQALKARYRNGEIKRHPAGFEPVPEEDWATQAVANQHDLESRARERREQQQHAEARERHRRQLLWEASNIFPRHADADLDALGNVPQEYRDVADQLRTLIDEPGLIALLGVRGAGKTHLAVATGRYFCRNGKSFKYLRVMDLFRLIRNSYGDNKNSEQSIIDKLIALDLLVLDEIQVRSESPWENAVLADLIDSRYGRMKPTILIGNLKPDALKASVGDSICSRLQETGVVFSCEWPSFRKPGTPQRPPEMVGDRFIFPPLSAGYESNRPGVFGRVAS